MEVIDKQWVLGMALRAHCKDLAKERSDGVNILTIMNVALKVGTPEVGKSRCLAKMADRKLVQDRQKTFYNTIQVRNYLACYVCRKSFMACIRVSSNLTFNDEIKQCTVLVIAMMQNSGLQSKGRVIATSGREGDMRGSSSQSSSSSHDASNLQRLPHCLAFDRARRIP